MLYLRYALCLCLALTACKKSGEQSVREEEKITISPTSFNDLPITPGATANTKKLFNFLKANYGKKIISGVMTLTSFDETNWLKTNTGKEPVILGLDFMNVNAGYTWYNDNTPVNDAQTWWNKNGIAAFTWHWRDPSRVTKAFYTKTNSKPDGTTFDVEQINDPTSDGYKAMIDDIDKISLQLKKLNDLDIPVIWRPLHEAAGKWFWWGAKGAQPCKKLYQIMYDRMVNYHQLKNLIWVWTREPNDQDWYPGDSYVDIVGRDMYKTGDHSSHAAEFNTMNALYGGKKMLALSECGSMPDPDNLVKDSISWSWFMPWYGDFTRSSTYNSLELWKKVMDHPYVITLDEMISLK